MIRFLVGVCAASVLWGSGVLWQQVEHRREMRKIEEQAFEEGYGVKQRNNLLERENRNLVWQYNRLRREHGR